MTDVSRGTTSDTLLAASIFWCVLGVTSTVAALFLIGLWSDDMIEKIHIGDHTFDFMTYVLDFCNFFAILPGFVRDRYGATVVVFGASFMNCLAFVILVLARTRVIPGITVFASTALMGQAAIWTVMAVLSLLGQILVPADKGKGVGLGMTWFSLAPVAVSGLVQLVLGSDDLTPSYYVVCGIILTSGAFIAGTTMVLTPKAALKPHHGSSVGLPFAFFVSLLFSLSPLYEPSKFVLAFFIPLALVLPLVVVIAVRFHNGGVASTTETVGEGLTQDPCQELSASVISRGALFIESPQHAVTLREALSEVRFWLLFAMLGLLCAAGMEVSNHVQMLAEGVGLHAERAMDLFAVGNSLSRLLLGYFSDLLVKWVSRGNFLIGFTVLMAVGLAMLSFLVHNQMAVMGGIIFCGIAFGAPWMLVPTMEMEWYGDKHFGSIHGFMMLAACGGVTFLRVLALILPSNLVGIFQVLLFLLVLVAGIALLAVGVFGAWKPSARKVEVQA